MVLYECFDPFSMFEHCDAYIYVQCSKSNQSLSELEISKYFHFDEFEPFEGKPKLSNLEMTDCYKTKI